MRLLITPSALESEFVRLTRECDSVYVLTAWAGVNSIAFETLRAEKHKIGCLIAGIHFYQTHPDFIRAFLGNPNVRFIIQPKGIFHPKLYLFRWSSGSWSMLVGSANFTRSAFTENTEATVLISDADDGANVVLDSALRLIDESWDAGIVFDAKSLADYQTTWKNQQAKIKSLSGEYGSEDSKSHPVFTVPLATMSWKTFVDRVRRDPDLSGRLEVLKTIQELFSAHAHFSDMSPEQRKYVAGLPTILDNDEADAGLFGSMKGSGAFRKKIGDNDADISSALDRIPLSGPVTSAHFQQFLNDYRAAFPETVYLAPATRLLAMKRPDTFVCFDSRNKQGLCGGFGIKQSGMTYERYWTDIIERLEDCEWWLHAVPNNEMEEAISRARTAFLDSLFYKE